MPRLTLAAITLGSVVLNGCASMNWPEHGAGGMAEQALGGLVPVQADQPLTPEHGLRFDMELAALHFDSLVMDGAELCFPATVVQLRLRQQRIARELQGGLTHDAANDLLVQRQMLSRLERQLDQVRQADVCVIPTVAGEVTPGGVAQRVDELLNADNQFAFGSFELNPKYVGRLAEAAALLRDAPHYHLEITGHADGIGSADHNRSLSLDRAHQVSRYLNIMGIPGERIRIAAAGSDSPLFAGNAPEQRLVNRRVSISLIETANDPSIASHRGERQ
ncbi:MAG: OmpA family protein [Gammaproteobacteria bacterium]|nr:OmpA family protein [Gammaproteobacteria bacterium]